VTATPNSGWVTQQARNLLLVLGERHRQLRFVLRDRDAKFSRSFDGVFCAEGVEMLVTPVQAPNANAHAERWDPDGAGRVPGLAARRRSQTPGACAPSLRRALQPAPGEPGAAAPGADPATGLTIVMTRCLLVTATIDFWHPTGEFR